jgi:hypothetical protein
MEIQEQIIARYENLRSICQFNWEPVDLEKIEKAFLFAQEIIGENKFKHGEIFSVIRSMLQLLLCRKLVWAPIR